MGIVRRGLVLLLLLTLGPAALLAQGNESTTQMQLVGSAVFLARLQYLMVQTARNVKGEALNTPCHLTRTAYATNVINSPASAASTAAVMVAGGVNVIGTVTGSGSTADSSASDAAIFSQIGTYWSWLAGCDTGS